MAFGIGINTAAPDYGNLKGKQLKVACDCWFSISGDMVPRLIRFEDEEGNRHSISEIQVLYSERRNFNGIPSVYYRCNIIFRNMKFEVSLIFFIERCQWVMNYL